MKGVLTMADYYAYNAFRSSGVQAIVAPEIFINLFNFLTFHYITLRAKYFLNTFNNLSNFLFFDYAAASSVEGGNEAA